MISLALIGKHLPGKTPTGVLNVVNTKITPSSIILQNGTYSNSHDSKPKIPAVARLAAIARSRSGLSGCGCAFASNF